MDFQEKRINQMSKPQFQLNFIDNNTFLGNSLQGDWKLVQDTPIERLTFNFAGIRLTLENYEEYNHVIEKISLMGKGNFINKILIIGRENDCANIFEFDLKNKRFQRNVLPIGQEYNNM